jgi:Uncharacterised nucleotidyltransferase
VRPQLLDLFDAYRSGRTDYPLSSLHPERLAWALKMGLGPILALTCRDDPMAPRSPEWNAIRAADLAARVVMEEQRDATSELIEACAARVGELTLLKGIWLSETLYPEPHLRPMRDVDVMVAPERVPEVEEVLLELGYDPQPEGSADQYRTHHHAVPYCHPATGVWVEVHRRLLPARGLYGTDPVFEPPQVLAHAQADVFRGLAVRRLSDSMQLLYLAAHWAGSFKAISGAGGLLVMLDLLAIAPGVDWDEAVQPLPGTAVASALLLLLSYLESRGLLRPEKRVMDALWRSQRSFGKANLGFLHLLMDLRLADGRAYGRWIRSRRNLEIVWNTFLRRRPALLNAITLPWYLIPERWRGADGR